MRREQQIAEVLRIRIDGAQEWDVRDYIRDRETGEQSADPWIAGEGKPALTEEEITALIRDADAVIVASVKEEAASLLARQIVQRRTLYARAVNNGELSVALACLRDEANLLGLGINRRATPDDSRIERIAQAIASEPERIEEAAQPERASAGESAGGADS